MHHHQQLSYPADPGIIYNSVRSRNHTCASSSALLLGLNSSANSRWHHDEQAGTHQADPGISYVSVMLGGSHTMGFRLSGAEYVWGNNVSGQLGDGTNTNRLVPTSLP